MWVLSLTETSSNITFTFILVRDYFYGQNWERKEKLASKDL